MSGNPKQIFRGITPTIFARLRQRAFLAGIHVAGQKGEVVKDGVKIQWNYHAGSEMLEVECRTPFWINSTQVNTTLRYEIEATIHSARAA